MEYGYSVVYKRTEGGKWMADIEWLHTLYDGRVERKRFIPKHDTLEQLVYYVGKILIQSG